MQSLPNVGLEKAAWRPGFLPHLVKIPNRLCYCLSTRLLWMGTSVIQVAYESPLVFPLKAPGKGNTLEKRHPHIRPTRSPSALLPILFWGRVPLNRSNREQRSGLIRSSLVEDLRLVGKLCCSALVDALGWSGHTVPVDLVRALSMVMAPRLFL